MKCRRKGAATVEFAVVLPIFVMLILGVVEMGRAVNVQQTLTNASREAARIAAIDGMTEQDVRDAVAECLTASGVYGWQGFDANGNPIGKPCLDAQVDFNVPSLATAKSGDPIAVTVTLQRDKVSWLPGQSQYLGTTLQATTTMRKEAN